MRLFVAIQIPHEIRIALAGFVTELRSLAPQVKWVRAENLHVTLKFLGETDPSKLELVLKTLQAIRRVRPITLEFRGLGFFPSKKRARVLWAGMVSSANLPQLAQDIDRNLHALGFPGEANPFTAHLTLARFNPPGLPPSLAETVKQHSSRSFRSMTVQEFHLIESKLKSSGAEYTTLQSFPFVSEN